MQVKLFTPHKNSINRTIEPPNLKDSETNFRSQNNTRLPNYLHLQGDLNKNYITQNKPSSSPSFLGANLNLIKYKRSITYIDKVKAELAKSNKELNSLEQLDVSKLDGIFYGLETFKNMKPKDLPSFTNVLSIIMQTGCKNHCLHCFVDAPAITKFNSKNILHGKPMANTIAWESLNQMGKDINKLNKRLGFNLIFQNRILSNDNKFYSYIHSDPIAFASYDKNGKVHNIANAAERFYSETKIPFMFSTAGWDIGDKYAQQAASDVCKTILKNPDAFNRVDVSIHPFQIMMTKANRNLEKYVDNKSSNPESAKTYYQNYIKNRTEYVDRTANVLKSFLPIIKTNKVSVDSQYAVMAGKNSGYTKKDTEKLCRDILIRLEEICQKEGIDSSILTKEKDISKNQFFNPTRKVFFIMRDKTKFSKVKMPNTFHLEKHDNLNNIVIEPFDKDHFFGKEVASSLTKNFNKDKNFFSNVILNIDLDNNIDYLLAKNSFISDIEAKTNFDEKIQYMMDLLSTIPSDKLKIRFSHSGDINEYKNEIDKIKGKLLSKKEIDKSSFVYSKGIAPQTQTSPKESFEEILDNLPKQKRTDFISILTKTVGADGQFGVVTYNTPHFGYETLKERTIQLTDIGKMAIY